MSAHRTRTRLALVVAALVGAATAATGAARAASAQTGAAPTGAATAGSVAGVVHDSIAGAPLADAAVVLWNTPHRAVTDADGRFLIEDVPPGPYDIVFFHTRLGELGISTGPRRLVVRAGAVVEAELGMPSMATLVRSQCLMEDVPASSGAVGGRVLDAESDVTLAGTVVTLSWGQEGDPAPGTLVLEAGPDGWYRSCAVPANVPILISAEYYGRRNQRREVVVDAGGYVEEHLPLYDLQESRIAATLIDAVSAEPVEGAEAWLRGTSHRTLSDGKGRFVFEGVAPGTYMLVTDHLAYGTKMDTLVVPDDRRLLVEMRLDTRPIPIAPLTVTTEAVPVRMARARGGIVITSEQIDEVRQRSRDASDIIRSLHIPGIIVRHQSNGVICVGYATGQVKLNQTGCVEMMIYVNDVRATDADLALRLPPDAIERMVVYKPVEAGNLFGLGGGNGVWVIYTRGN